MDDLVCNSCQHLSKNYRSFALHRNSCSGYKASTVRHEKVLQGTSSHRERVKKARIAVSRNKLGTNSTSALAQTVQTSDLSTSSLSAVDTDKEQDVAMNQVVDSAFDEPWQPNQSNPIEVSNGLENAEEDLKTMFIPPPTARGRERRFPRRFQDFLPNSTTVLPHMPPRPPPNAMLSNATIFNPPPETEPQNDALNPIPPLEHVTTRPNSFGMYRVYPMRPTCEVNESEDLHHLCDSIPGLATNESVTSSSTSTPTPWWKSLKRPEFITNPYAPLQNSTIYGLVNWTLTGGLTKSIAELGRLIKNVLLKDTFNQDHLRDFSPQAILCQLDSVDESVSPFAAEYGWKTSSVHIPMPCEGVEQAEESAPLLEVPNVRHRTLLEAITTAFRQDSAQEFHYTPFQQFWKRTPESQPERVITELYNSDAFYGEHISLMKQRPTREGPQLEIAIAAIMLWSDSTHLASFGNASLWPIYLYFGNLSKYTRAKPSSFSAHHIAYIPSLPKNLQDIYSKAFSTTASAETITHLKRELMHAIWSLLLDKDFIEAYEHGIVMQCADGVWRLVFPRFFTYSADYPEKVLLANIRFLGQCPCPRCKIKKEVIPALGTHVDSQRRTGRNVREDTTRRQDYVNIARRWIFNHGKGIKGADVEGLLKDESLVPTRNAFSTQLAKFGFNYFSMFVPDLLHEFELGVWKHTFTHLIRIYYSTGEDLIPTLNKRYRTTPTFGEATIWRFSSNPAAMTKLAARDFEDVLQCAMPVMEGLLSTATHNKAIQDLLFTLCTWHALAKLRLHTESTLSALKFVTRELGYALRHFVTKICIHYDASELPREEAARKRRKITTDLRKKGSGGTAPSRARATSKQKDKQPSSNSADASKSTKVLNLFTYKLHALGDYVEAIWKYGTSDGFSTQVGELEHKVVKRYYAHTNKNSSFQQQISTHQRRQGVLHGITKRVEEYEASIHRNQASSLSSSRAPSTHAVHPSSSQPTSIIADPSSIPTIHPQKPVEAEPLPPTLPEQHHHIGNTKRFKLNLFQWVNENKEDEAFALDFIQELKDHILSRIMDDSRTTFTNYERDNLEFVNDYIYQHRIFRVNFTTYDLRRSQDTINPYTTHSDIMMLSKVSSHNDAPTTSHPFSYARVLRILDAEITYYDPLSPSSTPIEKRVQFLWVRWFEVENSFASGWEHKRQHRLKFVPSDRPQDAFGFVDPANVIRAVHLIPAYSHGTTDAYLGSSIARNEEHQRNIEDDEDYRYHYVNMFVDRDMFMRFMGGGIGHKATNPYTTSLLPAFLQSSAQQSAPADPADNEGEDVVLEGIPVPGNIGEEEDPEADDTEDPDAPDDPGHANAGDSCGVEGQASMVMSIESLDMMVIDEGYGAF
ncbi:hypothetical protein CVT24_009970 [Panaeolus cyanescens]|uniref:Uncharacterized protein n=1 Tax=Panaeolus cyanescens TaxID=181874 RepID=A0A409W459_9AGAR|nr:hypothetical protein CVT24_009970 [Panaeolus cyanescens]